jgi:ABC-type sugar transport system ATPase subunit
MAEVVLSGLGKVFPGGTVALEDVDLTIADGEFVVLVGPSGCGKSTLLRIVAGLEDATAGTVTIDGRVVDDLPPKERDIAMVFQNYALYPHMTVAENMAFSLRIPVCRGGDPAALQDRGGVGPGAAHGPRPKALSGGSASASRWGGR